MVHIKLYGMELVKYVADVTDDTSDWPLLHNVLEDEQKKSW